MKPGYYKGELRPCPFCQNEAGIGQGPDGYFVSCIWCGSATDHLTGTNYTELEAIEVWNTRPAFDKAIHSLISAGLADETFFNSGNGPDDPFIKSESISIACELTGLNRDEALEVYKQRQEEEG